MVWLEQLAAHLWQNVWAVIPLAIAAAFACRVLRCGPATRHAVWVVVLAWFLVPPLLPAPPSEKWFREAEEGVEGPALAALSSALQEAWSDTRSAWTERPPGSPDAIDDSPNAPQPALSDGESTERLAATVAPQHAATREMRDATETRPARTPTPTSPSAYRPQVLSVPPPNLSVPPRRGDDAARPAARRAGAGVNRGPIPAAARDTGASAGPARRNDAAPSTVYPPAGKPVAAEPTAHMPAASLSSPAPGATTTGGLAADLPRSSDSAGAPAAATGARTTAAHTDLPSLHPRLAGPLDANPSACPPTTGEVEGRRTSLHSSAAAPWPETKIAPAQAPPPDGEITKTAISEADAPRTPWWRAWLAALLVLRNVLMSLPAVPVSVWAGGAAAVLLWNVLGVALFFHRVRRGSPAPSWVVREAQRVASRLGLRRLPAIRVVDARVSPMVWCGWRPMLILPIALWRELDHVGRCAILCHELAHLRRRDHWVLRLDLLVSVLFWWHPVAWWTRRRIHEEADNCCDAWVTWLMPRNRRAYAEALLKTRVYIENTTQATPAMGVAVTTPGARRLARRLTMVMTQSVRPRQSMSGFLVAAVVLTSGWMLLPAVTVAQSVAPTAPVAPVPAQEAAPAAAPVALTPAAGATPASAAPVPLFAPTAEDGAATSVTTLGRTAASGGGGRTTPSSAVVASPASPLTTVTWDDDGTTITKAYRIADGKREALTALLSRSDVPLQIRPTDDGIEVIGTPVEQERFAAFLRAIDRREERQESRSYRLPAEKLEALYALMVRDDVPIVVSRSGDTLSANGTPSQLAALDAFVGLIHPEGAPRARGRGGSTTPRGAMGAGRGGLSGSLSTPAPPALYGPGGGVYAAPAQPAPQAAPKPPKSPKAKAGGAAQAAPPAAARMAQEGKARGEALKARNEALQAQREALRSNLDNLRARQKEQQAQRQQQMKQLRERARQVQKQSETLEPKVRQLQEEMDAKRRKAEESGDDRARRRQLEQEIRELQQRARELEREVRQLNRESAQLELQASDMEAIDDPMEIAIESLEADIEALDEAAGEAQDAASGDDHDGAVRFFLHDALRSAPASVDLFNGPGSTVLYSMMAGAPVQFDDHARAAVESALREAHRHLTPQVRGAVRDACAQARNKVRQSLESAMRDVQSELRGKLDGTDMQELSQRISEAVSDALSEAMDGAFDGLDGALDDLDLDFEFDFQLGGLEEALKSAAECAGGAADLCPEACKQSCSKSCLEACEKKDGATAPASTGSHNRHEPKKPAERP